MSKKGEDFSSFDLNFEEEMSQYNGNIACRFKKLEPDSKQWTIKVAGYYTKDCYNYGDMTQIISKLHNNNFKDVTCFKDQNKVNENYQNNKTI